MLIITVGLPGSGKTSFFQKLAKLCPTIPIVYVSRDVHHAKLRNQMLKERGLHSQDQMRQEDGEIFARTVRSRLHHQMKALLANVPGKARRPVALFWDAYNATMGARRALCETFMPGHVLFLSFRPPSQVSMPAFKEELASRIKKCPHHPVIPPDKAEEVIDSVSHSLRFPIHKEKQILSFQGCRVVEISINALCQKDERKQSLKRVEAEIRRALGLKKEPKKQPKKRKGRKARQQTEGEVRRTSEEGAVEEGGEDEEDEEEGKEEEGERDLSGCCLDVETFMQLDKWKEAQLYKTLQIQYAFELDPEYNKAHLGYHHHPHHHPHQQRPHSQFLYHPSATSLPPTMGRFTPPPVYYQHSQQQHQQIATLPLSAPHLHSTPTSPPTQEETLTDKNDIPEEKRRRRSLDGGEVGRQETQVEREQGQISSESKQLDGNDLKKHSPSSQSPPPSSSSSLETQLRGLAI